jgi:hypothetical protein
VLPELDASPAYPLWLSTAVTTPCVNPAGTGSWVGVHAQVAADAGGEESAVSANATTTG